MTARAADPKDNAPPEITLSSGEALTTVESRAITGSRNTSLVVIVGSPGSGKTTLIATLFHCFQRGPFAGFSFAGSETCVGLDQRCHLGRTHSRGVRPSMPRTPYGEARRLLHFRVARDGEDARDVLLSDVSGEEYDEIRNNVQSCREFALLQRADHLVVLIDGERLADPRHKHAAKIEAEQHLGIMKDSGHFMRGPHVYVLVSKADALQDEVAVNFAERTLEHISERFAPMIDTLVVGKIAARPVRETDEHPLGGGLGDHFASWVDRPGRTSDLLLQVTPELCHSEFDRLLLHSGMTTGGELP